MALYFPLPLRSGSCDFSAYSSKKGYGSRTGKCGKKQRVVFCKNENKEEEKTSFGIKEQHGGGRREVVLQMVFSTISLQAIVPNALADTEVPEDFKVYSDEVNKFKIQIPQDWQVGSGEPSGFKSVTAFYPEEASGSNVSVVITGLGADFTRLESFGKVDAFAENLVNGLDRSWQRPPGIAAKLIDCRAANGFYYIEYWLQNPGESRRHLFSAVGMANNGWYNRLYTVTGQYLEEESEKFSSKIEKVVASFRFI
ncbi:hypothetical protein AAG906_030225 [Vitis piasezkii]|uniref:PsbP C-terminal domain-containing protein n=1 Tax=Vitis vinifera TaxID=29760 RepID=D7UDF1_VITVI|eukprot:XP_002273332.1 PREDICTED: psbP domain-containing protein 3, chloroplastic [Vitis vinifera]